MKFGVKNGTFGYTDNALILDDINFVLDTGTIMAILGSNGAGKTTLLRCMMGLLKWKHGTTLVGAKTIREIEHRELWKSIAYVPQAKHKAVSYTGLDMVVLGRNAHMGLIAKPKKTDYEKAKSAMGELGIAHMAKKLCSQMSGGEYQMILIARALVAEPRILVLDEPESSLDFKNQLVILNTIELLAHEKNISCIFNTHYPDHALKLAKKSLLLTKDRKNMFGNSEDIITKKNMLNAFEVFVYIDKKEIEDTDISFVTPLSIYNPGE